jgi:hypothetical protein
MPYFLATQPDEQGIVAVQQNKKNKKSGFKIAADGRLIITEDSTGSEKEECGHDLDSGKFVSVKRITTTSYSTPCILESNLYPNVTRAQFLVISKTGKS